ncbi:MAG: AAA family ATPase [Flavobacteriales bacterium]
MEQETATHKPAEQLASSFVPEILRREYALNPERKPGSQIEMNQAALLWIDICEFSPMCNRLIEGSTNGVEQLTSILQRHYEYVLTKVVENGGEPVVYAGDGILVAWPSKEENLPNAVLRASTCAHDLLANREVKNDLGQTLSLHMVLASGPYQLIELGGVQQRWMYTLTGTVLSDLIGVSKNRAPDELLISGNAASCLPATLKMDDAEHGAKILRESPDERAMPASQGVELTDDAVQHLQSFVPRTLSFPLNPERLKWIAELRPVTVVFVQLPTHGFDLNTTVLRLKQALSITMGVVGKMEGIVNQVWIDEKASNILVCFGPPPTSHVDNPERGVRTAFEIHETLKKVNFDCSIGVTSGTAYCGLLGNHTLRQYTVIGDAVNLASRLAGLKEGVIFVDKATHSGSHNAVDYVGPIMSKIKGHKDEVAAWLPIRLLAGSSGKQADVQSMGREGEMKQLADAFSAVAEGKAKTIVMEGDTGMGKSLLAFDFQKQVSSPTRNILLGKGDPIERLTPYRSWRNIFALLVGWDTSDVVKPKEEVIHALQDKYASNACLLNIVLQLEIPDSDEVKAMPASKRTAATQAFLLSIIQDAAATCPLAMVIDESQWMDELSWNLLAALNENVQRCLVVLLIQRAESNPHIAALVEHGASVISLGALSKEIIQKIICSKLGCIKLSDDVLEPINKVAKGNPFFSAELAGSMLEQGVVKIENDICILAQSQQGKNIALPETVRGLVRMRVDALGQGSQLAVKVGSIVGDRFETNLVQSIYPIESEKSLVSSFLHEVNQFGLISPTMIESLEGYLFNSATTAEVVYEMTLAEQRKMLHLKSAEWYETNFKDTLMPFFNQLAHHWEHAGDNIKASDYLEREAVRLISMGYTRQAIDLGLKALGLFGVEIPREPEKVGPMIGATMGEIAALMNGREVSELINLKKLDNPETERLIVMLTHVAPFTHMGGRVDLFAMLSVIGLKLTLQHGNGEYTGDVYSMYSIVHRAMTGDSMGAYNYSQLALAVDEAHGGKLKPRVAHVHCWFINHWVRSMHETAAIAMAGADAGLQNGDVMFMCFNLSATVAYMAHTGIHLEEVVKIGRKHNGINNKRVVNAVFHTALEMQITKALQGRTPGNTVLSDEEYDDDKDIGSIQLTDFASQIVFYHVAKTKINAHYGQWDEAVAWIDKASLLAGDMAGQIAEIEYHLFGGLALLYLAAQNEGERAADLKARGEASVTAMQQYATLCKENFEQKAMILDATREGLWGDAAKAQQLFEEAARIALVHNYINDCALAQEHCLRMQHRLSMKKTALAPAIEAYKQWGAYGKATYLSIEFS